MDTDKKIAEWIVKGYEKHERASVYFMRYAWVAGIFGVSETYVRNHANNILYEVSQMLLTAKARRPMTFAFKKNNNSIIVRMDYEGYKPVQKVVDLVDWMIKEGCEKSESSSYIFYADEIRERFDVTNTWLKEYKTDIENEILTRIEVLDLDIGKIESDFYFDMVFGMDYCKNAV